MNYRLAVFDMDGTILNTLEDLTDTMNHCLKEYGMPERTLPEIRNFVGNGIYKLVERAVTKGTNKETTDAVFQSFMAWYKNHSAIKTKPYPHICETILRMKQKGVKTAVVSNKADLAVVDLCHRYFEGLFDLTIGEKEGLRKKPYPDGVLCAIEHFNVSLADTVYIGDSDVDWATAKNADVNAVMVAWGFRDETLLRQLGAETIIHSPQELLPIILGSNDL